MRFVVQYMRRSSGRTLDAVGRVCVTAQAKRTDWLKPMAHINVHAHVYAYVYGLVKYRKWFRNRYSYMCVILWCV